MRINSIVITLNSIAFPETSVIRQWFTIENESIARVERFDYKPSVFKLSINDQRDVYYAEWFNGGKPTHDSGGLNRKAFGLTYYEPYQLHLESQMTADYVPLILLTRDDGAKDGVMTAIDYIGPWSADVFRPDGYAAEDYIEVSYCIDGGEKLVIEPLQTFETAVITFATYSNNRDNLMITLFDWQYKYLWDYTNPDYYAKSRGPTGWVFSSRCLTEQFNYRTAVMNLEDNFCQESGFEMVWDDAGWSALPFYPSDAYGSVFQNNYEGPDYRPSQKYFKKAGLKWLLWFAGKPSISIMENKEAAWGSFEWRTDDIVFRNKSDEKLFKKQLQGYLERNPERSFHTCSLGGRYAHTFDMQRLSNYNYLSDAGAGYNLNYYYSYFEVPDKSGDILASFGEEQMSADGSKIWNGKGISFDKIKYSQEFSRRRLGMVPYPTLMKQNTKEQNRFDNGIYRYLKENGVAGRWSYAFHPTVYGDSEHYYLQRMDKDCKRGCIIIGHCPKKAITIFPSGLIDDVEYEISFQNRDLVLKLTGKELTDKGLFIENVGCGEIIYLNLSDHPGVITKTCVPSVKRAFVKSETNIGHDGIGIYWIPVSDKGISHYNVYRNSSLIASVAVGNYWFDYSNEYSNTACYEISAVGYNGVESAKTIAEKTNDDPFVVSALGNHSDNMHHKSWSAEYSYDLVNYENMDFIPPENCPLADLGGTPNQIGGIEGYFEAVGGARVGRGWQQTSKEVYCVRKYTVQKDGKYHISSRIVRDWYHQKSGGKVSACILLNNQKLLPFTEVKKDDIYGIGFSQVLNLKKGDQLRFVLDKTEKQQPLHFDQEAELISFMPVITLLSDDTKFSENLRINCGSTDDALDEYGNLWLADKFYEESAKTLYQNTTVDLLNTATAGEKISYSLDVPNNTLYAVKFRFSALENQFAGENVFDILINGVTLKLDYDIAEASLFKNKICEQVFWNILPHKNGKIDIVLKAKKGKAWVQGIEVAPVISNTVRINCGANEDYVDYMGNVWKADTNSSRFNNISANGVSVRQASPTLYDQGLYTTAVTSKEILYQIPLEDSLYSVHLKFAELWLSEEQMRPVDIFINDKCVLENWDCQKTAGYKNMAYDLRFDAISPKNKNITVKIVSKGFSDAILQAIEIETEI